MRKGSLRCSSSGQFVYGFFFCERSEVNTAFIRNGDFELFFSDSAYLNISLSVE